VCAPIWVQPELKRRVTAIAVLQPGADLFLQQAAARQQVRSAQPHLAYMANQHSKHACPAHVCAASMTLGHMLALQPVGDINTSSGWTASQQHTYCSSLWAGQRLIEGGVPPPRQLPWMSIRAFLPVMLIRALAHLDLPHPDHKVVIIQLPPAWGLPTGSLPLWLRCTCCLLLDLCA
jgi:hypothetical protein